MTEKGLERSPTPRKTISRGMWPVDTLYQGDWFNRLIFQENETVS